MTQVCAGILAGEAATIRLARRLAPLLRVGDILALWGDMGVGKSVFARALIRALTGAATVVPSPTFTLVQTYATPVFPVWHFDLWRLETPEDAFELGFEDAFADAVSIIEWPARLDAMLPPARLDLTLEISGPDLRTVTLAATPMARAADLARAGMNCLDRIWTGG